MAKVPNIFHFIFGLRPQTEPFHLMYYLCLVSCLKVNQPDAIMLHYSEQPWGEWWERIKPALQLKQIEPDSFITSYTYPNPEFNRFRYAHLADIARLEILIKYGGVYADIDTLFVNPLPKEFFDRSFIMGREKLDSRAPGANSSGGSLCNAWMMGEPGALFAENWLSKIYKTFDGSWSGHSTLLPYRLSKQYPELIQIEPEQSFFAFDWSPQGIRDIFEKPLTISTKVMYSIHLWNHLWWERGRTDFSLFHSERLTPEYLRYSQAAYAVLARKFIPLDVKTDLIRFIRQQNNAFWEERALLLKKRLQKLFKKRRGRNTDKVSKKNISKEKVL